MRQYLKKLRDKKQLTQTDIEKRAGIKSNYYCMIENGDRQTDMSLSIIEKLAKAFGVSVQTIVREEMKYKKENQIA